VSFQDEMAPDGQHVSPALITDIQRVCRDIRATVGQIANAWARLELLDPQKVTVAEFTAGCLAFRQRAYWQGLVCRKCRIRWNGMGVEVRDVVPVATVDRSDGRARFLPVCEPKKDSDRLTEMLWRRGWGAPLFILIVEIPKKPDEDHQIRAPAYESKLSNRPAVLQCTQETPIEGFPNQGFACHHKCHAFLWSRSMSRRDQTAHSVTH